MKYVIEIDEEEYKLFERDCINNGWRKTIEKAKPLQAELEKIKAEVEQCYYNNQPNVDGVIIFKEDINNIFNKHISELKGE